MDNGTEERKIALKALQEKLPEDLFSEPIDFIFADHFRQRTLCGLLELIATSKTLDAEVVQVVLEFMMTEFRLHVLDEEKDFFPLLRKRAEDEDDIETILNQLSEEHVADEADAVKIISTLQGVLETDETSSLGAESVQLFTRFAANEKQHLSVENAIVLPLARVRLTEEDQQLLGQNMAARRGVVLND